MQDSPPKLVNAEARIYLYINGKSLCAIKLMPFVISTNAITIAFNNSDSSGIFLLIMSHIGDSNRTSAMAIAVKNYNGTSYSLTSIIESNVGSGFTLSSDNSYIVCSGSSSHKVISAIALNGYASSIIIENL